MCAAKASIPETTTPDAAPLPFEVECLLVDFLHDEPDASIPTPFTLMDHPADMSIEGDYEDFADIGEDSNQVRVTPPPEDTASEAAARVLVGTGSAETLALTREVLDALLDNRLHDALVVLRQLSHKLPSDAWVQSSLVRVTRRLEDAGRRR